MKYRYISNVCFKMEVRESQNAQLGQKKSQHLFALVAWKLLGSIKQALSFHAGQSRSLKVLLVPVPSQKPVQGKGVGSYMVF